MSPLVFLVYNLEIILLDIFYYFYPRDDFVWSDSLK